MVVPSRAVTTDDIPVNCQIGIGDYGYVLANWRLGLPPVWTVRPQLGRQRSDAIFVSSDEFLTMRDYDYFSRIFLNDFRRGMGQVAIQVDDPISKTRFYDSLGLHINDPGRVVPCKAMTNLFPPSSPTSSVAKPLLAIGGYLYAGSTDAVVFHADWSGPLTSAATSATGLVSGLTTDGQYVYGIVDGRGINRWSIGSGAAGTLWNSTSTAFRRITWANRLVWACTTATLYEINTAGTATARFTPPTGWTLEDIAAKRGGAIDAPIIVLASRDDRSFLWYWDGTNIHDYVPLPTGFVGRRIKYYLGTLYISGFRKNDDGTVSPCAYYVQNDQLGFLGYFGIEQTSGLPTPAGDVTAANYSIEPYDRSVYFAVGTDNRDIFVYDIVNGGISRFNRVLAGSGIFGDIVWYRGGIWATLLAVNGVYKYSSTFNTSATLDTSDLHLGQPWAENLWLAVEITHSPLLSGEQIAVSYSLDQGATYTSAGAASSTVGATRKSWTISTSAASKKGPYVRLRFTFTSPSGSAAELYTAAIKAAPMDPSGLLGEFVLACPHEYNDAGKTDFQGATGSQRLRNIVDLYEAQSVVKLLYPRPNTTRDKLVQQVDVKIVDYEWIGPSSMALEDGKWVEGDIRVVVREVI